MSAVEEATGIPHVSFQEWRTYFGTRWEQGEHVTILGHTGSGKTTIAYEILPIRDYVIVLATKPKDPLLSKSKGLGYHVSRQWPIDGSIFKHNVLWPKIERMADIYVQHDVIGRCLNDVYTAGGWCIYLDEVRYVCDKLRLRGMMEILWLQGRSQGVSIVATSQRPAWIPLEAYQSADHLFMFRESDMNNLKRLKEIGGVDRDALAYALQRIPKHDCIYVNTRDGDMFHFNARR